MNVPKVLLKLTAFVAVCVLSAVVVVNTLTNPLIGETVRYRAVFSNAEGLREGSDVRVAGVRVGTVNTVELVDGVARVSFEVRTDQRVLAGTRLAIQYADLLGARYLALQPADGANADKRLEPGSTIPDERTSPALDLTKVLNGFKPLFEAIEPAEVNKLARQIVGVLQGEGGTITSLLSNVVAVTSTVNSRDEKIGEVVANLNKVLGTVSEHSDDIKRLVGALAELAGSVADNRELIANALDSGANLAASLSELLDGLAPDVAGSVHALRDITGTLTRNQRKIEHLLGTAPEFLRTMNRTLDYGSWVNVYVCGLSIRVVGKPVDPLAAGPNSKVCR